MPILRTIVMMMMMMMMVVILVINLVDYLHKGKWEIPMDSYGLKFSFDLKNSLDFNKMSPCILADFPTCVVP